jgi:hypothetical protein
MKTFRLAVLIAGLCFLNLKSEAQTNGFITNGLIAFYPFNGNANDQSGNGNNGTVFGATLTDDRFGVPGMAYQFNGTNDYISANVPNLPTGSAPRTVSLWAQAQPITTTQGVNLLFWGNEQNQQAFGILNNSSPYTWQGESWGGGDDVNSGVIVDTNWHNVVVEYDGANLLIFLDGIQRGSLGIVIDTGFSQLTIGGFPNNQMFSGAINDVLIYNRALSLLEIAQNLSASTNSAYTNFANGLPFITNGLVAYYPFNGNANDVWGTNNGTIQGEAIWTDGVFGGATNNALYFDGETRVVVQDSPSLDPTNAITLAAWFNADNWDGNPRIISKGEYNFCDSFGSIEFDVPIVGSNYNAMVEATLPSSGVWHYAVSTYDGCSIKIYVDGQMVACQPASGVIAISNPGGTFFLNIGAKPSQPTDCCPTGYFNGSITDAAIYNRALSSLEVAELYQSSLLVGITVVPGILVAGNANQMYSIQYITNISSTNWTTLVSNIVLQGNSLIYPDTNAVGQPQRFYRVVAQ